MTTVFLFAWRARPLTTYLVPVTTDFGVSFAVTDVAMSTSTATAGETAYGLPPSAARRARKLHVLALVAATVAEYAPLALVVVFAIWCHDHKTLVPNGIKMRAARQHGSRRTALHQRGGDLTADGAGTDNTNLHHHVQVFRPKSRAGLSTMTLWRVASSGT